FQGLLPYLLLSGQGGFGGGGNNFPLLAIAASRSGNFDSRLALLLAVSSGTQTNSLAQALLIASVSGFGSRRRRDDKAEAEDGRLGEAARMSEATRPAGARKRQPRRRRR